LGTFRRRWHKPRGYEVHRRCPKGVARKLTLAPRVSLGEPSNEASIGKLIQYLFVGLLVALAVKNYLRRETVEPPRWLGTLLSAD
jgi:hypothetical protein